MIGIDILERLGIGGPHPSKGVWRLRHGIDDLPGKLRASIVSMLGTLGLLLRIGSDTEKDGPRFEDESLGVTRTGCQG
jgi:hypothetical protein